MICVTAELGDFNPDEHKDDYLAEYRFIPSQTEEFEKEVVKNHQSHRYAIIMSVDCLGVKKFETC